MHLIAVKTKMGTQPNHDCLFSKRLTKMVGVPILLVFCNDYNLKENPLLKKKYIKAVSKAYIEENKDS